MPDVTFAVGSDRVLGTLTESRGPSRGTLILVHGLQSCRREFGDAPERLAERGFTVLSIDLRGCGESGGERGILSRRSAVEDVRGAIHWLREEGHARARIGIVGHSLGGALAAACLAELPDLRSGVLVAPVNRLTDEVNPAELLGLRLGAKLSKTLHRFRGRHLEFPYKMARQYERLFDDKEAAARARQAAILSPNLNLGNFDNFHEVHGAAWAKHVTQPTLVVLCKNDRALKPRSQRKVYDALAGPKQLVELDSGHSAFGDRNAARLIDAIDGWMGKALGAIPQV